VLVGRTLPLAVSLTTRNAFGRPEPHHEAHTPLGHEIIRGLLKEALLSPRDLPDGFMPVGVPGAEESLVERSLFDGSEFEGEFLTEVQARYVAPATGQLIEQHIGMLSNESWRARSAELDAAPALAATLGDGGGHGARYAPVGDRGFAAYLAQRYEGTLRFDAIFLRRHKLMMALGSWQIGQRRPEAPRSNDLAPAADARWSRIADLLK
jgi:hypothetical protein